LRKSAGWLIALTAVGAIAQENAPSGLLRGSFLAWTGTPRNGQFTFQTAEDRLYSCSYDEKTYIEREKRRVTMAAAEKGDRLEIVTDRRASSTACYARTVHIADNSATPAVPGVRPKQQASQSTFRPRTYLHLNGAVSFVSSDTLILRTPSGERESIRLRPDTRYFSEGQAADPSSLHVNTVVFIQAARNLYDELEAYQVIWGDILRPGQ